MKTMITIPLDREEAITLTKMIYRSYCDASSEGCSGAELKRRLLEELGDLLEVEPWDL